MRVKSLDSSITLKDVFQVFAGEPYLAFLASSLQSDLGRYSILGRKPYLRLKQVKGELYINDVRQPDVDFDTYLEEYLNTHYEKNLTNLPIVSGCLGYFSYDYASHQVTDLPTSCLNFYDELWVEDHLTQEVWLIEQGQLGSEEEMMALSLDALRNNQSNYQVEIDQSASFKEDVSKETYLSQIEKVQDKITSGEVYVMNLTQRFQLTSQANPIQVFRYLYQHNPAPFSAYLDEGEFQIISASPERFFEIRNGKAQTRPIKGTVPRGATPSEDKALKQQLQQSAKEQSELMMIVDMERNDLNRFCQPGTVKVPHMFTVESYATVHHLVSEVEGLVKPDVSGFEAFRYMFPGGSITGAPKESAMSIIQELEVSPRGIYTGAIGYFSLDGDCDWNIVIRSLLHEQGRYELGVGGGITIESHPEEEHQEIYQKGKALLEAFGLEIPC